MVFNGIVWMKMDRRIIMKAYIIEVVERKIYMTKFRYKFYCSY